MPKLLRTRGARLGFGLALSGLCLYLAIREVEFAETARLLGQADAGLVGLALLVVLMNVLVKILRWGVLLGPQAWRQNRWQIANAFLSAQLLNAVLPLRAGEVSRVIVVADTAVADTALADTALADTALSRPVAQAGQPDTASENNCNASMVTHHAGVAVASEAARPTQQAGYAAVIGSLVLEKIFDMLAYSLLIVIGLFLIILPTWLTGSALLFLLSTLLAGLVLIGLLFFRRPVARLLNGWAGRLPKRYAAGVQHQLQLGFASLDVLVMPGRLLPVCIYTVLIWASALLINQLAALALGMSLSWSVVIVLLVALQAGISLPSLPARVGIFEFVCVWVLQYFEIPQPGALSYGILLHVIVYLPIIILGALSLMVLPAVVRPQVG